MDRVHSILHRAILALALLVLAAAASALVVERTGWLERWVRDRLVTILGEPLEIESVSLSWLDAALEIEGLSLGLQQDAVELNRVRIIMRAGRGGLPRPALIEVQGGHVILGEEFERRVASMQASDEGSSQAPAVVLRNLQIDVRHPALGVLPIGRVHAAFESDARGRRSLTGHLTLGISSSVADSRRGPTPLYLTGDEFAPGEFALSLSADGSPFSVEHLPAGKALDGLRASNLRGRLSLFAELRVSLARLSQASGHLRARLNGGSLSPSPESSPLTNVSVDLDVRCAPGPGEDVASWGAWRGLSHIAGSWRGARIESWGVVGSHAGASRGARAWVRAEDLPLDQETREALRLGAAADPTWNALTPSGFCSAVVACELGVQGPPRFLLEVECAGRTEVSYVGWPPRAGGPPAGFPMPVEQAHGRVVALFDMQRTPRMHLGIFDARGSHRQDEPEEGTVWLRGQVLSQLDPTVLPEWDMRYGARRIAIDGGGIPAGLSGLPGTEWIWPAFAPVGGEGSFEASMQKTRDQPRMASQFLIRVEGLNAAWEGLPMPVQDAQLDLELRFDPRLAWGAGFHAVGHGATSEVVDVSGRLWSSPRDPGIPRKPGHGLFEQVEVRIANVSLRGTDRQILGNKIPEVERALEQIAAAGKVDVFARSTRHAPDQPVLSRVEISPREVTVSPQAFRVQTRNVLGRVLVTSQSQVDPQGLPSSVASVRLSPLVGDWPGGAVVACTAEFEGERGELSFMAAGLEPLNRGLVGALRAAVGAPTGGVAGLDLSALSVDGRVDAHGTLELGAQAPVTSNSKFNVFLRENDFRLTPPTDAQESLGFGLSRLNGILIQEGGELTGSGIRATLGRTPVILREARFSLDDDGYRLETRPSASALPLDREHLRFFLDPVTIDALIDELGFGGTLDIDDARLVLSGRAGEAGRVSFEGSVRPRDLVIDLGLPVEVTKAAMQIERLVFEDGGVRAWATVEDLEGQIAGRRLEQAQLQLTYVEPHLSILDLEGQLEDGRLAHLGGTQTAGAPAFSMDLVAPFPFDLGLALEDVDVQGLLRGIFESDFASTGRLSGELRLTGDLEHVRAIHGDGSLSLRDTTLWSIPVMRALFSQLGFDDTAVFERIRAQFGVRDGEVNMSSIQVYSPLLQLVGSGQLDLEGRLHHDLEVRYSLVDSLGPFRRILYWVQNNLLRIAVRGDMSRPRVEIEGVLSFLTGSGSGRRDLPLPALTPLPVRF